MNPGKTTRMTDPIRNITLGLDQIAIAIADKWKIITKIIHRPEDIPELLHLLAIMVRSLTSETILVTGEEIILVTTEETIHVTEVTSPDISRDKGLETNTDHMDVSETMHLHTGVMEEEQRHQMIEMVEGTDTATTTILTITEEGNLAALQTDHLMTTEVTDRILKLSRGGPETLRDKIPDHHQQGETSLSSVEDQHQEKVEMGTITATDVGVKITFLQSVNNSRIGGENPVIAVSCTKGETAT